MSLPESKARGAAPRTLLVVDDEREIRSTLALMLDFLGYAVREAESGEEALRVHAEAPVDGIVLDVRMYPGISGDETLTRLRASDQRTPVILCSGSDEADDLTGARALGPTSFLLKPYTLEELISALASAGL